MEEIKPAMPQTTNRPLRVFLCHSSQDKPAVRELYQKLRAESWIQSWLDEEELYPGQDWNLEIEKAVEAADAIIVCLSKGSITKEGYVQRELRIVLDYADNKPEGTLYLMPVRLEECEPPRRLRAWQYADYFDGNRERALQRLLVSLKRRAESLGLKIVESAPEGVTVVEKEITKSESESNSETLKPFTQKRNLSKKKFPAEAPQPAFLPHPTSEWVKANRLILSNGMEFMSVVAGKFIMGSYDSDDEKPEHVVYIPYDYWMGRFPVTNMQYNQFKKKDFGERKENHPVVNVSWGDAMDYCKWLNQMMKLELPSGSILRLPTESEWEKSARGTDWRAYPWGNAFDKNKSNAHEGNTTPVGLYSPQGDSPYGCADMIGNVWEWTLSLKYSYPYQVNNGREDENYSGDRVVRGGDTRCACRVDNHIYNSLDIVGFRVVVAPHILS